jgi:hypothetical protein
MSREKFYALYKGDEVIAIGTLKELGKLLNVSPRTIFFYSTPTYRKRNKGGNSYIVIRIDDEE